MAQQSFPLPSLHRCCLTRSYNARAAACAITLCLSCHRNGGLENCNIANREPLLRLDPVVDTDHHCRLQDNALDCQELWSSMSSYVRCHLL